MHQKLVFEIGSPHIEGISLPEVDVPYQDVSKYIPEKFLRKKCANLPEVSESEIVRHYIKLSNKNHHVDKDFYPLGSCTMKYNPKINEETSSYDGLRLLHPHQPSISVQGALQILYEISEYLCEISGLSTVTLQPSAGAHGELTGLMIVRAYHESLQNKRKYVLIPDSAHGTNPATVSIAGFVPVTIKSNENGLVDIENLRAFLNEDVAAFMLTNPNTLGIFEDQISEIAELIHKVGALLYMDGANMNALLGIVRPGDIGFDIVHFNLHKTFSTPHGGGGPGSGPIAVAEKLKKFLPKPFIQKSGDTFEVIENPAFSIGRVSSFWGNFAIIVRAYTYIRMLGETGLKSVSRNAIINANYLWSRICDYYDLAYKHTPMHEFVICGDKQKKNGVKVLDIAKRLLDFGVHAPTVYFPLIVSEAMMIEPTETESKSSIDRFADVLIQIAKEVEDNPDLLLNAPTNTPVSRLDEAAAARNLNVRYRFPDQ